MKLELLLSIVENINLLMPFGAVYNYENEKRYFRR